MGVAAIAAAAGGAGVGSMDSASIVSGADLGGAFSGASADGTADPDLPIATARYGEEPPAGALLAAQETQAYRSIGPVQAIQTVSAPTVTLQEVASTLPRSRMTLALAGGPAGDWPIGGPPTGANGQAFTARNTAAPPTPRADALIDTHALMVRLGPTPNDAKRGRWFVFAAGSGKAFGLNLIRDPVAGWRQAGWSVERLAEFGKVQLGLGWRKGASQVSVAASRRELGAYGLSREDTVFGVSFSLKPGR
jgi:hypothetical protein